MTDKKERKSNLITVRITDDEMSTLDYLSDCLGKNKSDVIVRACKFFLSSNDGIEEDAVKEKVRKNNQVHLRMTESDMKDLNEYGREAGVTTSQTIRNSIKYFERFMGSDVMVRLYRPKDGCKEFPSVLRGYEDGKVTVTAGKETITFEKSEVALVRLRVEF